MSMDVSSKGQGPIPPSQEGGAGTSGTSTNYLKNVMSKLKSGEFSSPTELAQLINEIPELIGKLTESSDDTDQTASQADQDVMSDSTYAENTYLTTTVPTSMDKPDLQPDTLSKTHDDKETIDQKDVKDTGMDSVIVKEGTLTQGSAVKGKNDFVPGAKPPSPGSNPPPVPGSNPPPGGTPTTGAIWLADNYATQETISMLNLMYTQALAQLAEGNNVVKSMQNTMEFAIDQGDAQIQAAQSAFSGEIGQAASSFAQAASSAVEGTLTATVKYRATNEINQETSALKNNPYFSNKAYTEAQGAVTATEGQITAKQAIVSSGGTEDTNLVTQRNQAQGEVAELQAQKTNALNAKDAAQAALDPNNPASQATLANATAEYQRVSNELANKETDVATLNTQIDNSKAASVTHAQQELTELNAQLGPQKTQLQKVSPGFDDVLGAAIDGSAETDLGKQLAAKKKMYTDRQSPETLEKLVSERGELNTKIISTWSAGFKSVATAIGQSSQGLATLWQAQYQRLQTLEKAAQDNTQQALSAAAGARDKFQDAVSSEASWLMSFQQMRTQSFWQ